MNSQTFRLLGVLAVCLPFALGGCSSGSNVKPKAPAPAAAPMAMEEEEPMEPAGPTEEEITADGIAVAMAITADPPATPAFDESGIVIKHTEKDGMSVTVSDSGANGVLGDYDDEDFEAAGTPPTIKGWHGSMHRLGEQTETVSVYTNIQAPARRPFSTAHVLEAVGAPNKDTVPLRGLDVGGDGAVFTREDGSTITRDKAISGFPTTPSTEKTSSVVTYYPINDITDLPEDQAGTVRGRFDGATGVYRCSSDKNECTATANADGTLKLSDDWMFIPEAKATISVLDPDADYIRFGYWLESTEDEDGEVSYGFQAFSGGSNPFDVGVADAENKVAQGANMSGLKGSATYAGPAGGMYVKKSLTAEGGVVSATSGAFTANAELTANFGGPKVARNNWWSISGVVNNFRDGTMKLDGWSVDLKRANFVDRVDATDAIDKTVSNYRNTFNGTTTGGGSWNGMFFGASASANESVMPSGVAGEFNGNFTNGHVNGAFGAVKQ